MRRVPNLEEVFTFDAEQMLRDRVNMTDALEGKGSSSSSPGSILSVTMSTFAEICSKSYDLPQVSQVLEEDYDLIFMQPLFNECALGLVSKFTKKGVPLIFFLPTAVPNFIVARTGNHFPSSFVPNTLLGLSSDEMDFKERFVNFGVNLLSEAFLKLYYQPKLEAVYREKLGDDEGQGLPSIGEVMSKVSLILANTHFSLSGPKPYLPNVVDVGGIHERPAQPLPKDLEDFVSKSGEDGFILFSMGSGIQGSQMPPSKRDTFLRVFSRLKQQVLWKWETESMPGLPKNVKLSKWLPQQDLLGHKGIKLFITHCGGGSTEEAIYHGVPLVGIPITGDQWPNCKMAKSKGLLIQLDWFTLTEEDLLTAIQEILRNPSYKDRATSLSTVFRDQPETPLERGVYWVEYILRHKGAPHLQSAAKDLNFLQFHSLDVITAWVCLLLLILYIPYKILRLIIGKLCGTTSRKTSQSEQQLTSSNKKGESSNSSKSKKKRE